MKYIKSPLGEGFYWENTKFEKFLLYKLLYPVLNMVGLNRKFNLLRHRLGLYAELSNGLCQWCGQRHIRFSEYKDLTLSSPLKEGE